MVPIYDVSDKTTQKRVREPAVAGMFYPENPRQLIEMIDEYLDAAKKVIHEPIGGLVAPHAGYVYSGPVAAWSFKQVAFDPYEVVVVIAPSHFEYFHGASIYSGDFYATPLGEIPVARALGEEIASMSPHIFLGEEGHHHLDRDRGEHALEVELPFLQRVLGDFVLVPIVMGEQTWPVAEALGNALASVLKGQNALIVASSDLSHYYPYDTAYSIDKQFMEYFNQFAYRELLEAVALREVEACGAGPIVATMHACQLLGYRHSKAIRYATSGDVPYGEKAQVVGYMAGVIYQ